MIEDSHPIAWSVVGAAAAALVIAWVWIVREYRKLRRNR